MKWRTNQPCHWLESEQILKRKRSYLLLDESFVTINVCLLKIPFKFVLATAWGLWVVFIKNTSIMLDAHE